MVNDYWKTLPQYLVPKGILTRFAGAMAEIKIPAVKNYLIRNFITKYGVNMSEALVENPRQYSCFNDFFIRHLKPEKRPLAHAGIVSPVDGCVSEVGGIEQGQILQAKGRYYTVNELLACGQELSDCFLNGQFATLYLAPKDYHRIHMPISATLTEMIHVPGKLFSVQPATVRVVPQLFARNERLVVLFDAGPAGLMAMVLVGATIVGAIGTAWQGDIARSRSIQRFSYPKPITLRQGDEMGYFKLGSTVIMLFTDGAGVSWSDAIRAGHPVRFGQAMGEVKN